jgi:hypothetical protein
MRKDFVRAKLEGGNEDALAAASGEKVASSKYYPLLALMAQVSDAIAEGEDVYLQLNTTKARNSLVVSLSIDKQKVYVSAANFADLADRSRELL